MREGERDGKGVEGEGGGVVGKQKKKKKNSMSKTILSPQADPIEKSPGWGRAGVVRSGHGNE